MPLEFTGGAGFRAARCLLPRQIDGEEELMTRGSFGRMLSAVATLALVGALGCQTTAPTEEPADTGSEFTEAPVTDGSGMAPPIAELQTVYFEYDSSNIRSDARGALKSNVEVINGTDGTVTVEGHCDERGSSEYNLALGERRANAVKRYLVDLGVPSSKLRTVSFGEDRPAVQGHDESAWRYNRRADFTRN